MNEHLISHRIRTKTHRHNLQNVTSALLDIKMCGGEEACFEHKKAVNEDVAHTRMINCTDAVILWECMKMFVQKLNVNDDKIGRTYVGIGNVRLGFKLEE